MDKNASVTPGNYNVLTACKSEENQGVNEEEFHNVDHHTTQGNLERSQMWVDGEHMDQFESTET